MNQQQIYIQKIKNISLVNIQVANLSLKSSKEYKPGFRYNIGKYEIHDERNILINEIVFDFDWSSYVKNFSKAKFVADALNNRKIPHYIFATGGKGIHIHCFFKKIECTTIKQKKLMKEASSYDFGPKNVRLWFWNLILEEAGIEEQFRGKYVDSKVVKFNYFAGTSHLIRDCGGRKILRTPEETYETFYKTYISPELFTKKKITIKSFDNVRFPVDIRAFDLDISELSIYLKQFVKSAENRKEKPQKNEYLKINYRDIDGVLKLREGIDSGSRSMGAFIISVACKIDRLSKKETTIILDDYVNKCSQVGHKFTLQEANQWMDWVYNQEFTYWNCSQLIDLNVHDNNLCEFCMVANKEANAFLTSSKLIETVKEVLDIEIIGENDIKILIFLLLLSKDFPSETGKLNWNIIGDPMSQNVILASDSSSGKTHVAKRILKLFGTESEDYFVISRMSKSVINYYTEENMDRKIIFVEEMQGLDENTSQLRVWMSEGKLSFDTVEKVKNEEGIETNTKVTKTTTGQPCFLTCQAEGEIGEQINNRSWLMSLDVSEKQTKKILRFQTELNKGNITFNETKMRIIRDALKQLKPYHFIIEYLDEEFMNIPTTDVRARRDYMKFITLIKCSAYLHQKQREIIEIDGKEFIKCAIQDYNIAKQYSHNILGATFTGLTVQQLDIINVVKNSSWKNEFSVYDLQRNFGKSNTYWQGQMSHLENQGYFSAERTLGKSTLFSLNEAKTIDLVNLPSGEKLLENMHTSNKNMKLWEKSENDGKNFSHNLGNEFEVKVDLVRDSQEATSKNRQPALKINVHGKNDHFSLYQDGKSLSYDAIEVFIKNHINHMVSIIDIIDHFGQEKEELIESIITTLKRRGTIYEPKPGQVMAL